MSANLDLFPEDKRIGIFRGFSEGGLEFHADILIRYKNEYQDMPMHGQFILVQLGSSQEAVVGRITNLRPEGRLSSSQGEEFAIRHLADNRPMPDDIRKNYLRYRVSLRVLGVLRVEQGKLRYAPSHRRLPHVGSIVGWPSDEVLRFLARDGSPGEQIGFLAMGEYIYAGTDKRLTREPWMQVKKEAVMPTFDVENLVARRTFIFARAGFGKSNLNKLLFSQLYTGDDRPKVKIGGKPTAVGTIIFDPDGEYFWPDANLRPGLCDVPALENKVVVFTPKDHKSQYYQSFKADEIRLDIRRLKPKDVIEIALDQVQQGQQNVRKLKSLPDSKWRELVDLVDQHKNLTRLEDVKDILGLTDQTSDAEAVAARSNMTYIVNLLHNRRSQLLDKLLWSLKNGKLCIVDISNLRGKAGLSLAGIILQRIFQHNVDEFTKASPALIPVIAVIEEAQSVLGGAASNEEGPFVMWVKEGRKYNLGAVMVTQQPASITKEILSQGDNWFVFHLLSHGDLEGVRNANAHFSKDILSSLLNEPIPGHGAFWSSVPTKDEKDVRSYPLPIRVLDFQGMVGAPLDPDATKGPGKTYAVEINPQFEKELQAAAKSAVVKGTPPPTASPGVVADPATSTLDEPPIEQPLDVLETHGQAAIKAAMSDPDVQKRYKGGMPWFGLQEAIRTKLPPLVDNPKDLAYSLVAKLADALYGKGQWTTEYRPKASGEGTTLWVVLKK